MYKNKTLPTRRRLGSYRHTLISNMFNILRRDKDWIKIALKKASRLKGGIYVTTNRRRRIEDTKTQSRRDVYAGLNTLQKFLHKR